jgi:sulfotransferase family protein
VRVMLAKVLQLHFKTPDVNILGLGQSKNCYPGFPGVAFIHDDVAHWRKPEELETLKYHYAFKKVVFLVRDPRDVVISIYFEKSRRLPSYLPGERREYPALAHRIEPYRGELTEYLEEPVGGFDTILKFYNIWAESQHIPGKFMLIKYEDMHSDPEGELRRLLKFIGMGAIDDECIREAISFSSFDRMKSMEREDKFKSDKLRPGNINDAESFKVRKGKVGGFAEYLTGDQIAHLTSRMNKVLSPYFGYTSEFEKS